MGELNRTHFRYVIGIDEAGRGPLAGPVSVAAVLIMENRIPRILQKNKKDSKRLSPQKRRCVFSEIEKCYDLGELLFAYASVSASVIDLIGINRAIKLAIGRVLRRFQINPIDSLVLLDGGLRAPRRFAYQETIIRGDEREPLIALASIVAKVLRDKKMERLSERYPEYSFNEHKGYGTKLHKKQLKRNNPSPIHRKTYLRKFTRPNL